MIMSDSGFKPFRCVTGFVSLILKALQGRFVVPDFSTFTEETQKLFSKCRQLSSVQVSSALTPADQQKLRHPNDFDTIMYWCNQEKGKETKEDTKWSISICTVDGQRLVQLSLIRL